MRFPDAFLIELKFRSDIEETVSRYLPLKAAGANYVACCPFHSEKTPSFTVSKSKQMFYCFGCGAGGSVINFVMLIENIDFVSAVTKLAEIARLPLPEGDGGEFKENAVKQKKIFEINREAALYFYNNLTGQNNAESRKALDYVYSRNIKSPTVKHFGLGYASDSWDSLTKYLTNKGFAKEEQRAAFLCSMTKKGEYVDIFRGRLMFPIIDVGGNVIAFGGRVIAENGDARKYVNTSDTPAFKKSRNLYALNFAKNAIGSNKKFDYFILCEGNIDVISLHQAGFTNAVATLGTAVTGEQARLMSKYAKQAVLAYDNDEAGRNAMKKAAALLGEVGMEVKVWELGDAKDPDEFIKKYGRERLENQLARPKGYTESRLDAIYEKYDLNNADEKIKAINEACSELAGLNSGVEREVYGVKTAERYKISQENILKEIKRLVTARQKKEKSDMFDTELRKLDGYGDRVNPDRAKYPDVVKTEESILGILFNHPEIYAKTEDLFGGGLFVSEFNKKIFELFKDAAQSGLNFDTVMITKDLTPDETSRVTKMTLSDGAKMIQNADIKNSLEILVNALKEKKAKAEIGKIDVKGLTAADMAKIMEEKKLKHKL